jgi:hypothetical protein
MLGTFWCFCLFLSMINAHILVPFLLYIADIVFTLLNLFFCIMFSSGIIKVHHNEKLPLNLVEM